MSAIKIITIPDQRLFVKCEDVTDFGPQTQKIVQDLLDTTREAKDPEGAGMAAPQIGFTKRICVVRDFVESTDTETPAKMIEYVLINPVYKNKSKEKAIDWESCFSVPNIFGMVERPKKIKIEAFDEHGKKIKLSASGFFARVIQHEMDHLDGIIFTQKVVGKTLDEQQFDQLSKSNAY